MNPPREFIHWMNVFLKVGSLYGEGYFDYFTSIPTYALK
jgi:hypothetical protein